MKKTAKQDIECSQWVVIADDDAFKKDGEQQNGPFFCKLRHPKSGEGAMFLFNNEKVFEVIKFKQEFGSCFIDSTVQQDGSIQMMTIVDPVFLVLPYLTKEAKEGKFKPLDQVVNDEDFPECSRLCHLLSSSELQHITEVKGADDYEVVRYSLERCLAWLTVKVERLSEATARLGLNVDQAGSCAATYVKSSKSTDADKENCTRYAFGMVSDYLSPDLSSKLKESLGIKDVVAPKKSIQEPPHKKQKLDPIEDYSNNIKSDNTKKVTKSAAQKKLEKVDKKGMKSVTSFFAPKTKR